jgi:hypothetical protein
MKNAEGVLKTLKNKYDDQEISDISSLTGSDETPSDKPDREV